MNVYRDSNAEVTFEHPFEGPLVASVYRGDVLILESDPITPVEGRYTLELSFRETQFDGPLEIIWEGTDPDAVGGLFARTITANVITPLVPLSRLRTLFTDTNWTDEELMELENTVRTFIESYTGQSYGYRTGVVSVTGTGEKRLALPQRLIRATVVNMGPIAYFTVSTDGWYLYIRNKNYLTTKEAPPEEFMENYVYATRGVIHVPDQYWKQFRVGAVYQIDGEWGYYTVPNEVQEAALLLANDWGCGDNLYRDRYLEAVKYADTNLSFNQGAYRATGNARADQLLEPFRRQNTMVII